MPDFSKPDSYKSSQSSSIQLENAFSGYYQPVTLELIKRRFTEQFPQLEFENLAMLEEKSDRKCFYYAYEKPAYNCNDDVIIERNIYEFNFASRGWRCL